MQSIRVFHARCSEKSFCISASTYEKRIVCKENCIGHQIHKTCLLFQYKFHFLLPGYVEELLQNLDSFRVRYQHVHCLYTFQKNRFAEITVAKSRQVFDNVQRKLCFNQRNSGVDEILDIGKNRHLMWIFM